MVKYLETAIAGGAARDLIEDINQQYMRRARTERGRGPSDSIDTRRGKERAATTDRLCRYLQKNDGDTHRVLIMHPFVRRANGKTAPSQRVIELPPEKTYNQLSARGKAVVDRLSTVPPEHE